MTANHLFRQRRKRFVSRSAVIILLVSLYVLSLAVVRILTNETSILSTNEIEHRKRLSDFMHHRHEQHQQQRLKEKVRIPNHNSDVQQTELLESSRKNGIAESHQNRAAEGNIPVNNGEKRARSKQEQRNNSDNSYSSSNNDSNTTSFVKNNVSSAQEQELPPRGKLQLKLDHIAHTTHQAYGSNEVRNAGHRYRPLWELSDYVPPWMKEYFKWHRQKRQTLTEDVWRSRHRHHQWKNNNETSKRGNSTRNNSIMDNSGAASDPKFLVIQCLEQDESIASISSCGSLSERLALLPYWLRIAHETNRLLFIHWTVPTDLSEYLIPPVGGCDWRAPMGLKQMVRIFVPASATSTASKTCKYNIQQFTVTSFRFFLWRRTLCGISSSLNIFQISDDQQGVLINNESKILSDNSYLQSLDSESLLRVQLKHSLDFENRYNNLRTSISSVGESIITEEEPSFHQVFHDVWIIFFVPSNHIRKHIFNAFHDNNGMEPGHYTSIDLTNTRATEPSSSSSQQVLKAKRIFESASRLRPEEHFLVVTDAINVTLALQGAKNKSDQRGTPSVFARYKPLSKWKTKQGIEQHIELLSQKLIDFDDARVPIHTSESFYDVFVNLYLMAMGRCVVSYDPGIRTAKDCSTLGCLASLIGYDSSCYDQFSDDNLDWFTSDYVAEPAIFVNRPTPRIENYFSSPMIRDGADYNIDIYHQEVGDKKQQHGDNSQISFKKETKFPQWMEEYLDWHRATKSQLTRSNWNATNYLIVGCFESFRSCGGISDRLKPLPLLVWEAHQHQRILLIWWERPNTLEEWLIPPNHKDGGIDWTVPLFLKEEILKAQPMLLSGTVNNWAQGKALRKGAIGKNAIVYHIQTADGGEKDYLEEQTLYANRSLPIAKSDTLIVSGSDSSASSNSPVVGSSYQDVSHHLFRRFFTPAPRLAALLSSKMEQHNLVPNEYTAVHLRALYGDRKDRDMQETLELAVLGVNCASNMFPGAPVFFASDTSFAVDSAHAYGKLHGLPIVSLEFKDDIEATSSTNLTSINFSNNPIHLDKDPDWKNRSASAYDSTFVDLYMLAQSRCVAFSNGGYGTFGSLLSYDSKCKMRFFKGKHKIKKCIWTNKKMERERLDLPNVTDVIVNRRGENVSVDL